MVIPVDTLIRKGVPRLAKQLGRGGGRTNWSKMVSTLTPEARKVLPNHFNEVRQATLARISDSQPEQIYDIGRALNDNDSWGIEAGQRIADNAKAQETAEIKRQPQSLEPTQPQNIRNNLTVSKENIAPGFEGTNHEDEALEAIRFRQKGQAIQGKPGESGLSTKTTIGQLEGQEKGYNQSAKEKAETTPRAYVEGEGLGTKVEEVKGSRGRTRIDITAEIERMPYKELHHIFGKAMGEKVIDNVWRLIEAGKATVEDLINLNYWAKSSGIGMGDFGTEPVNRVPHSLTHTHSRKYGIEMSSADIEAMPEFDDIDELTSYFRELIETRVKPMRGELDLQQGAYDLLPDQMRLEVEQLKVAKEDASRDLTQSYKETYNVKEMPDTPEEVKDAYQTHVWIQEELGVTEPQLIEKAKKLDQARKIQDDQMSQAKEELTQNRDDIIKSSEGRQIAREDQTEFLPSVTTRDRYGQGYNVNRVDPETATERQMLDALTVLDDAKRQEYIDLLRNSEGRITIGDLVYKDSKGKWKLRKITKALRDKAAGKQPKSKGK